jgi:carlactone synthase/all-trans-10'-apo-beta-carotenal 13,14-cleaving dioxygenase
VLFGGATTYVAFCGLQDEDDGVVVDILTTSDGGGSLLILDASSFTELARCRLPEPLPFGFHGCWVPEGGP